MMHLMASIHYLYAVGATF